MKKIKFATGNDFFSMLPLLIAGGFCFSYFKLPFLVIYELQYQNLVSQFKIYQLESSFVLVKYGLLKDIGFVYNETLVYWYCLIIKVLVGLNIILLLVFIVYAFRYKIKALKLGKLAFIFSMIPSILVILFSFYQNILINQALMINNDFLSLTINSKTTLSALPYAIILIALLMTLKLDFFLDTLRIDYSNVLKIKKHKKLITLIIIAIIVPIIIAFGIIFLKERSYYFISLLIILVSILPFLMTFENRLPQAREIVLLASLVVIASLSRAVFFMLPNFKPMSAMVIIAGIALGSQSGFIVGIMSGFVSNFFFGQGPWTPWQMFALGIIGFLAGFMFNKNYDKSKYMRYLVCLYGGISVVIIYGGIVDISSMLAFINEFSVKAVLAIYLSGLPINITHGIATMIFLYLLQRPMLKKLSRIKLKYGMLEG